MSEIGFTDSLIDEAIKILETVVDAYDGVWHKNLKQVLLRFEEVQAHYRKQNMLIHVNDMHGIEDFVLQPVRENPDIRTVDLTSMWDGSCPICGNEYSESVDKNGIDTGVCPVCGFVMKDGWEKNALKIRYWVEHYSYLRDNKVEMNDL